VYPNDSFYGKLPPNHLVSNRVTLVWFIVTIGNWLLISMTHFTRLLLLLVAACTTTVVSAQVKLQGEFNRETHTFKTADSTYWVGRFKAGVATLAKDGYLGLIDTSGTILCPPKYDKIFDFKTGVARTGLNGKYGILGIDGQEVLPPTLKELSDFNCNITSFKENGWSLGLIDRKGKKLASQEYGMISEFKEGMAFYVKNGQYGIIDSTAKVTPLFRSEDLHPDVRLHFYDNYQSRWNAFRAHPLMFSCGRAVFPKTINKKISYGYINESGAVVIPCAYDEVTDFVDGYAAVRTKKDWLVIDKNGATVIPPGYAFIEVVPGGLFIVKKEEKFGLVDFTGKTRLPFHYLSLNYLFEDVFCVSKGAQYGAINANGKNILPFKYAGINTDQPGLGKSSIAKSILSMPLHTGVPRYTISGEYIEFDKNGIVGDSIYTFSKLIEGFSDWYKNDISRDYRLHSPTGSAMYGSFSAHPIKEHDFGLSIHKKNVNKPSLPGKPAPTVLYGLTGSDKQILIPAIYDYVTITATGAIVSQGRKFGFVDFNGKILIPLTYSHMSETPTGTLVVQVDTRSSYLIDKKGQKIER